MTDRYDGPERRHHIPTPAVVTTWTHVISTLGFPIVVALILLGMMTGYIGSPITRTADALDRHMNGEETRTRLIRTMCIHSALALKQSVQDCGQ